MVVNREWGPEVFLEPVPEGAKVAPSLVSTHLYLCSLTFTHIPDEVASVWRQQKFIFNNLIYCLFQQSGDII